MKKILTGITTFVLTISLFIPIGFSDVEIGDHTWSDKLSRGLINIVSSPVEIGRSISVTSHTKGPGYGWTAGLLKGLGMTLVRMGAGFIEVVTFPFDFPDENKAPLIKPEYPWQKWSGDYVD